MQRWFIANLLRFQSISITVILKDVERERLAILYCTHFGSLTLYQ